MLSLGGCVQNKGVRNDGPGGIEGLYIDGSGM